MITCQICNKEFQMLITSTHLKSHNMTTKHYKEIYGTHSVSSDEFRKKRSEQNRGTNNPNYNNRWTDDQKKQLSNVKKGNIPWNKGLTFEDTSKQKAAAAKREERYKNGELVRTKPVVSDELKAHLSQKTTEYAKSNPNKMKERSKKSAITRKERNIPSSTKGKIHSEETRKKLSLISSNRNRIIKEETISKKSLQLLEHNITFLSHENYKKFFLRCDICNHEFSCSVSYYNVNIKTKTICPVCNPSEYSNKTSKGEQEVFNYLKTLSSNVINNDRLLLKPINRGKSKEIDILLPDEKIAIEYNGIYWHSRKLFESLNKSPTSDNEKRLLIESLGYTSIQINESDWKNKKKIIVNYLKSIFSYQDVYKNNDYKIVKLTSKQTESFFNKNHIRGNTEYDISFGVKIENKIVAAMSFKHTDNIWELCSYASIDVKYENHFQKILLNTFIDEYNPAIINYYMDNCYPTNNLLKSLGMNKISEIEPKYWFYKGKQSRISKNELTKPIEYNHISDIEYFELQGYMALYDNGMSLWQWKKGT